MTALNAVQLLTFVAFLGLLAYAVVAPREANRAKRVRRTRLYSGAAMIAGAAFFAAMAADSVGWLRYAEGIAAVCLLVAGLAGVAKARTASK